MREGEAPNISCLGKTNSAKQTREKPKMVCHSLPHYPWACWVICGGRSGAFQEGGIAGEWHVGWHIKLCVRGSVLRLCGSSPTTSVSVYTSGTGRIVTPVIMGLGFALQQSGTHTLRTETPRDPSTDFLFRL